MNIKSKLLYIIAFIFLYFFFIFDINFHGPDDSFYFGYTASVVEDGDLNIINQVYPDYGKFVSKTYNLPKTQDDGGVVLWVPFYAYAKSLYYIAGKLHIRDLANESFTSLAKCAMSFSTVIFGFLSLILTYFFCRKFFPKEISAWSIPVIFLGTPFFYYMLFEVGNVNVVACLLSIVSIWICSEMMHMKKIHSFLYGLFFSICITVKGELLIQAIFIFSFFIILCTLRKISWKNGLYFLYGFLPIFALNEINLYLKYGTFNFRQIGQHYAIFFDGFFNSFRGIFYTSPIFYICFLGFIFAIVKTLKGIKNMPNNITGNIQNIFCIVLSVYLIIKLLLLNIFLSPGGDALSGRLFLSEFPILVLLFAQVIQKKYLKYQVLIISSFLALWNLLIISEFMTGLDWIYIEKIPSLIQRLPTLKYAAYTLFYTKDIVFKLKTCLPLAIFILGVLFYMLLPRILIDSRRADTKKLADYTRSRLFYLFVIYLGAMFIFIITLNLINNKRNVEKMKASGFFKDIKIIGPSQDRLIEVEEELAWRWSKYSAYWALKGDTEKLKQIKEIREKSFGKKGRLRLHSFPTKFFYCELPDFFRTSGKYKKAAECYYDILKIDPDDFEAYISLGDIYTMNGDYEKAITCFQQALYLNPKICRLYINLGELYYSKMNNFDRAIECFQKAITCDPALFDAYSNLGSIYNIRGEYDRALDFFKKVIQINPKNAEAYASLGDIYVAYGDYEKAAEYIKKAIQLGLASSDIYRTLGNIYQSQDHYSKAIEYYDKSLQLNPQSADSYSNLAEVYKNKGTYDKAIEYYEKSLQLNPQRADIYFNLAEAYKSKGAYDKAILYYQKTIKFNPSYIAAYANLGEMYASGGIDYYKAIKYYKEAIRLRPNDVDAIIRLGNIYVTLGDYTVAGETFEKAMQIEPVSVNSFYLAAEAYYKVNDLDKAIEYYEKSLQLNPQRADIYFNLAEVYKSKGAYDKAIEYYQQAIKLNPRLLDGYLNLADTYRIRSEYDMAISYFEKAAELNPQRADTYFNLAEVYKSKGAYDKATDCYLEYYKQTIKLNPNFIDGYMNLAEVYKNKGAYDKAIEYYEKSLQLNPQREDIYFNLAEVYKSKGAYDKAIEYYQQAIKLNPRLLDGYLNLADTYRIRSEYDMAISYFEKAAELNPQRADTYFNLAEVYNQRGDKERASKQVIKLRELNRHDLAKILEGAVK